jgi:hypothetical protein
LSETISLNNLIKRHKSKIFRKFYVKRRSSSTGLYETSWQEITEDVKKWGSITRNLDPIRLNKFKFSSLKTTFANLDGKYNPHSDGSSFWFDYLPIQRSLIKIRSGFINETLSSEGIWTIQELPQDVFWDDEAEWDGELSTWDENATTYIGIISGDVLYSDRNEAVFNIMPITQVFRDYPARNLSGYTSTGMTAQSFVESVRDHQDVNGNYIFRPFFDDSTANWIIGTTTAEYLNLNTTTASDVIDSNVWDIIQKLAESENFVSYINRTGQFVFKDKTELSSSVYEFHGLSSYNTQYGHNIKKIEDYGPKISKFYSRVEIRHNELDTGSSFEVVEATLTVSPKSAAWIYGQKTLSIENTWLTSTAAGVLAQSLFNDVSAIRNEIKFTTSFIPSLDIFDIISVTYDSGEYKTENLWDLNNWGGATIGADAGDLIFSEAAGDTISILDKDFKLISYEVNLDRDSILLLLERRYKALL